MPTFEFEESREEYNEWLKSIEALSIPSTFNTIFTALTEEEIGPKQKVNAKPKPENEDNMDDEE